MLVLLAIFFSIVAYHARLVEVTSRLDFLWKQQAEKELLDMQETRHNNTQLVKNILPDHVAQHFLKTERLSDVNFKLSRNLLGLLNNFFRNYILNIAKTSEFCLQVFQILLSFIPKT